LNDSLLAPGVPARAVTVDADAPCCCAFGVDYWAQLGAHRWRRDPFPGRPAENANFIGDTSDSPPPEPHGFWIGSLPPAS